MLALLVSSSSELKGRANARNVTLETLYGVQYDLLSWYNEIIPLYSTTDEAPQFL